MSHSFRELEDGIVVVELAGKLIGGSGAEEIPRDVRVRIDEGKRKFIFDFHEVTYADSTGIGAVLKAFSALAEVGGRMVFARVNKRIYQVLSIMRLDTVIQIFETEEEARHALAEE